MGSQAGSVPSHFGRFQGGAMLKLDALMTDFLTPSFPFPLLTQIQWELMVGSEGCPKACASPLTSHGPRVRNYSSKSGVRDIWIAISASPLPD